LLKTKRLPSKKQAGTAARTMAACRADDKRPVIYEVARDAKHETSLVGMLAAAGNDALQPAADCIEKPTSREEM